MSPCVSFVESQPHGFPVGTDGGLRDFRDFAVHLRAAVFLAIGIGEGARRVARDIAGSLRVHGLGEGQLEAVGLRAHLVDFKGHLAGPVHALE